MLWCYWTHNSQCPVSGHGTPVPGTVPDEPASPCLGGIPVAYYPIAMGKRTLLALPLLGATMVSSPSASDCPPSERVLEILAEVDLTLASRSSRFGADAPETLYRKALRQPGRTFTDRDGHRMFAVAVTGMPVRWLWKAINDDARHAGIMPIRLSEVVGGTPRGSRRQVFQYFQRWGIGRWWVSDVSMNRDLYESSDGRVWELYWDDATGDVDPDEPPMSLVSSDIKTIRDSRGAWLLIPITERCTVVELFNWSDPGGFVGFGQSLVGERAVRQTFEGLWVLAEELGAPVEHLSKARLSTVLVELAQH